MKKNELGMLNRTEFYQCYHFVDNHSKDKLYYLCQREWHKSIIQLCQYNRQRSLVVLDCKNIRTCV